MSNYCFLMRSAQRFSNRCNSLFWRNTIRTLKFIPPYKETAMTSYLSHGNTFSTGIKEKTGFDSQNIEFSIG